MREAAKSIVKLLRENGFEAYFVGGCVRDQLLGRENFRKDYDVATSAAPAEITALFPRAKTVGARFGVVCVPAGGGFVEVATYRTDHAYRDGRRPSSVVFSKSAKEDVQRRDFTINGMLLDPFDDEVLDFVGGRADLEKQRIRAIGSPEQRFREDHLRMLRAVRLAAALDFRIESETMRAIQAHADRIVRTAPERVRGELNRILTEGGARRGFELLDEAGLLRHILPEISALQGVRQPPQFHPEGDVWTHTLMMLAGLDKPSATLAWGTLLHDVGKPDTFRETDRIRFHGHAARGVEIARGICKRLRFSNADAKRILELVANHMQFMEVSRMRPARLKRFLWQQHFDEHLELHRQDCLASRGSLANYDFAREKLAELEREQPAPPRPPLDGNDLKQAGYAPGPLFREILSAVEEEFLNGVLTDKESALRFVRGRFDPSG